ncbi:UPF0682 family protein [Cavenderia fasciculata]|uniref:UPF0682 family protein n=1 Tax=Cavenderia fasciculata TaxID=261658 RepID=F4PHP5_CACFS|nr:UPF0682 family protein [Cavenderia fasciculata]EGG25229.1 UPF0682 family protein [Cavenderia fasciculata]|eukprot:XP_004363080.1 UPF0682 family protein [Cavenderia fasciculata]
MENQNNNNNSSNTTATTTAPTTTTAATTTTGGNNNNINNMNHTNTNTNNEQTTTTINTTLSVNRPIPSVGGGMNNTFNNNNNSNNNNNMVMDPVKTFEHLLRKSQRLFIGLRDLPQFGRQWQPFFQKTFELYTKLWKHQQKYRAILEDKSKYGLKRCEIGEIASKIGQLYYHYYLRTCDTNYLNESYIFYEAIRLRSYFKDVSSLDPKVPDMMVKQLRYYARFIVVCLLLNRKKVVYELVEEFYKHVDEYTKQYKPSDANEWSIVLQEIFTFLQAEQCISITSDNTATTSTTGSSTTTTSSTTTATVAPVQISHRLSSSNNITLNESTSSPSITSSTTTTPILQQAILVSNHASQIKFSEITLDMFRMVQSLEYDFQDTNTNNNNNNIVNERHQESKQELSSSSSSGKKKNPHKYLLYRPTISQLFQFLSNSTKEMGGALLLYLSIDGIKNQIDTSDVRSEQYSKGLLMNVQKNTTEVQSNNNNNNNNKSTTKNQSPQSQQPVQSQQQQQSQDVKIDALYPVDILPFCRRPFFLIIDSQSSHIFNQLMPPFDQPYVALLSPISTPKKISTNPKRTSPFGNLFTFYLHDPLGAFCDTTGVYKISAKGLSNYQSIVQQTLVSILKQLTECTTLHQSYRYFLGDDFLKTFILRFIFCHTVYALHKDFQSPKPIQPTTPEADQNIYQVSCQPPLPTTFSNSIIHHHINQLAQALNVVDQFNFNADLLNTYQTNNNNNSNGSGQLSNNEIESTNHQATQLQKLHI